MSYGTDFRASARRHFNSAMQLHEVNLPSHKPGCTAVAGYLFGLAGELAVKHMLRDSGHRCLPGDQRRNDPYYAHFPTLKTLLRDGIGGRRSQELKAIAENPNLFKNWDTDMRYAPTQDIPAHQVAQWQVSAKDLLERMDA